MFYVQNKLFTWIVTVILTTTLANYTHSTDEELKAQKYTISVTLLAPEGGLRPKNKFQPLT